MDGFRNSLKPCIAAFDEISKEIFQKQAVGDFSKNSERRRPDKSVLHRSAALAFCEFVDMFEGFENAARHFIRKMMRSFKFTNFYSERLPESDKGAYKRNRLPESEFTVGYLLVFTVIRSDFSDQIKTNGGRRVDLSFDN